MFHHVDVVFVSCVHPVAVLNEPLPELFNIGMCVVISSLSSSSLFFIPFMLTCSMMIFLSLLLLGLCPCVVSVVVFYLSVRLADSVQSCCTL